MYKIDAEMILCGFLADGSPALVRVDSEGVRVEDNFAAIGSGGAIAMVMLDLRDCGATCELAKALYYVYEAKRCSERAEAVNNVTIMAVQYPDTESFRISMVNPHGLEEMAELQKKYGLQPFPNEDRKS